MSFVPTRARSLVIGQNRCRKNARSILADLRPTPVVALNRAVAVAMRDGPETGLTLIDEIAESLAGYRMLPAARADLLRRAGRNAEARDSYEEALASSRNDPEHRFLQRRLAEVTAAATGGPG
jgi:RNA polymerase sigma-70 factor, ECF subfamily